MKIIVQRDFDRVYQRFMGDIKLRRWRVVRFQTACFEEAGLLLRQYGRDYSLRTLDSLQLAICLALQEHVTIAQFVSSDKNLNRPVEFLGVSVLDPEEFDGP